jgi:hypothetical protein
MGDQAVHLVAMQSRRVARLEEVWWAAAGSGAARCRSVWESVGWLGEEALDAAEFDEVLTAELAKSDAPETWESFLEHYNTMLGFRSTLFPKLYSLGHVLGEGGYGHVVSATRKGPADSTIGDASDSGATGVLAPSSAVAIKVAQRPHTKLVPPHHCA